MDKSLLDLYADYLISSFGPTTATGLSRLLQAGISHDRITRFLSGQTMTSAHLWQMVKPLVRQVQKSDAVLIIDDSIEEKPYTDENELVCWHYNHSKESLVKGINFLTTLYQTGDVSLPVAFALVTKPLTVIDKKTGKPKKKSEVTKNEHYRAMLQACADNQIPFRFVLNDVWFSAAENMNFIKLDLKKDFIMPLKSNRKVATSLEDKRHRLYQAVETLSLEPGALQEVHLEGVSFPLLLVKQVFTNKDGSQGILYLVTSDLTLLYEQVTTLYQKRWKVEEFHKSLKQNASLAKSPTRRVVTQRNHFFCCLCAFVKLESLKMQSCLNHFALKSKLYVSALQSAFGHLQKLAPVNLLPGGFA
jgi:hypothetical protein